MKTIMLSKQDASANIVMGSFEARFVQRTPDYFIIYVSSHKGCNQACRFCHLTQTKQTDMTPATLYDYMAQVSEVLDYWKKKHGSQANTLTKVHVNFMARGEPLLNPVVVNDYSVLVHHIKKLIRDVVRPDIEIRFNISTIFPEMKRGFLYTELSHYIRRTSGTKIYYSLYSVDVDFRKRWLPKAVNPYTAMASLRGHPYKIHHALIRGQNDSISDAANVCNFIADTNRDYLHLKQPSFNLVGYNPYSEVQGQETSKNQIKKYLERLKASGVFKDIKVVSRVGVDVYASCGTFVNLQS